MAFCTTSACVLVLLAVTFVSVTPSLYVSDRMDKDQGYIAKELKLTEPEIGGEPLFSFVLRSLNYSCQRGGDIQLMKATLDVYMQILSKISGDNHHGRLLDHLPVSKRPTVRLAITNHKQMMRALTDQLSQLNHDREKVLTKLNKIQVDDLTVQKKALAEYLEVYQAASVTGSCRG